MKIEKIKEDLKRVEQKNIEMNNLGLCTHKKQEAAQTLKGKLKELTEMKEKGFLIRNSYLLLCLGNER